MKRERKTMTIKNLDDVSLNEMVEEYADTVLQEAINHFNTVKNKIFDPEDDARYLYSEQELLKFIDGVVHPDKVWISTVKNQDGSFFAYRIGRIITSKRGGTRKI